MRIGVKRLLSCIEGFLYHMEECVPLGIGASGDRGSKVPYMPILCISQYDTEVEFWCTFCGKPKQD